MSALNSKVDRSSPPVVLEEWSIPSDSQYEGPEGGANTPMARSCTRTIATGAKTLVFYGRPAEQT